jgi:uncharacterized protein (DUF2267 family)
MQYDQFVGQVQHRAQLADGGQAVHAIRATLETLGERLFGGEAEELASQLPAEIGYYLRQARIKHKFGMDEFFERVSAREGVALHRAMHHARVVLSVLAEAVSPGEIEDVRAQLPGDLKWVLETGFDEAGYEESKPTASSR